MRDHTFKCLQAKWYSKLFQSGFIDIEKTKTLPNIDYRNASVRDREAIQTYFRAGEAYLSNAKFSNEIERRVWELHIDGLSLTQIKRALRVSRYYAYSVIVRHRERAGLKRRT